MTDQPNLDNQTEGEATGPDQKDATVQTPPNAAPAEPEPRDVSSLPKWAQSLIEETRREAGDARTNAKAQAAEEAKQELANEIGKALGLVKGDEQADPKQLAAQLKASQDETTDARRELAVYKNASKAGADPDALLDSNSFLRSIASVDPTDAEKITAAIKEAVKNNSKLSMAPRAGSRSGNDTGGSGEAAITKEAFDKMSGSEKNKLYQTDPDLFRRLAG